MSMGGDTEALISKVTYPIEAFRLQTPSQPLLQTERLLLREREPSSHLLLSLVGVKSKDLLSATHWLLFKKRYLHTIVAIIIV